MSYRVRHGDHAHGRTEHVGAIPCSCGGAWGKGIKGVKRKEDGGREGEERGEWTDGQTVYPLGRVPASPASSRTWGLGAHWCGKVCTLPLLCPAHALAGWSEVVGLTESESGSSHAQEKRGVQMAQ